VLALWAGGDPVGIVQLGIGEEGKDVRVEDAVHTMVDRAPSGPAESEVLLMSVAGVARCDRTKCTRAAASIV